MPYTLTAWQDAPSPATPISAANLLLANTAIQGLDSRLGMVETGKLAAGLVNAKGKLISSDNTATPTALLVGTDGQVLTADSAQALGLRWATPAAAGGGVPTSRLITTSTGLSGGGDLTADRTLSVTADTTTQRLEIAAAGTLIGTRKRVNLIQGANVTLTTADNNGSNQVDVTIAAATSGAAGIPASTVTTKADLIAATGNAAVTRLAASGNNGNTLTEDNTTTTGLTWSLPQSFAPVRAATTASITLSGTQTIDNIALNINDRVMVQNQSPLSTRGIYTVASGAWPRATDMATGSSARPGATVTVLEGDTYGNALIVIRKTTPDANPITVGTDSLSTTVYLLRNILDHTGLVTARPTVDFQGAGVTVTDDPTNKKTVVTIAGGGGGGTVTSVTAADSTITVGGTATAPTIAVNSIAESKVALLTADLAAKANLVSGRVPTAQLATGTASATTFLRGDQTWSPLASTGNVLPGDHNLTAWSFDPALCTRNSLLTSGSLYLTKMLVPVTATITTVYWFVGTTGATPTTGGNYIGIYDSTGVLLTSTAADASYTSAGNQATTITAQTITGGTFVWVAMFFRATTMPALACMGGIANDQLLINIGLTAANYRFAINGTGMLALPTPITPSANVSGSFPIWCAIGP